MPAPTPRSSCITLLSAGFLACFATMAAAQAQQTPVPDNHLVAPPVLAKLVPTVEGWTRGVTRMSEVAAGECNYTTVTVTYAKDENRVKLTLGDTGMHNESIMALASPVVILAADYAENLHPSTTIRRLKIEGSPAYEMWNGEKMTGEITVLVGGRFVVTVEAQKGDSLETLRQVFAAVDLKALAALK